MDEEQNNNEQNIGEQINNGIQDAKSAVKDGANLAKNASTGNVIGAIKDGFKLLGNKTVRRTILIAILIPIVVIIALASSVFSIFNSIGDTIQNVISTIGNIFDVSDWKNEGVINIDDTAIDQIIAAIESTGIDLEDLKLLGDVDNHDSESEEYKEALRKYVRKFYEAQVVTQTLNTNPSLAQEALNLRKTYGSVYLYRDSEQLTYMEYEEMQKYTTDNNINESDINYIKKYFAVNEDKLVIPEWTITTVNDNTTYNIILREVDYKKLISQYTTPMNFFIYLAMISQNPEFVSAVTDLVKGSVINLTVFDAITTNIEDETYTYTKHTKGSIISLIDITDANGVIVGDTTDVKPINYSINEQSNTNTTITTVIPTVNVTYVNTWFCKQKIDYEEKDIEPYNESYILNSSNDESLADDMEPLDPPAGLTVSWITGRQQEITIDISGTTYEESVRGTVEYKTDEFIELLDTYYKIPNTNRYEAAGKNNMISGAERLFSLMQKDEELQSLEQVMRYILGIYADKDYGVSSLDGSGLFNATKFLNSSSAGLKVKTDESGALEALTKAQLSEIIEKRFSGDAKTNLMSALDDFVDIQNKYNVNAVFAIAVTQVESSCGTNWGAIDSSTYNWFSITGSYNGQSQNGWRKYSSFGESVQDFGKLIATSSNYFAGGNITISSIGQSYCVPPEEWTKLVAQFVREMYESIGISVYSSDGNELQQNVVEVATNSASYGIIAKSGYCQAWVANVYYKAGVTTSKLSADCALHAGQKWGVSTEWSEIQVGATVYGYSNSVYGHVGIYIGDGMVAHNIGRVAIDDLDSWIKTYNGVCWGWNGVDLTGGGYPFTANLVIPKH